ncbi:hypothetical protein WJX73_004316 [Symbiochloris irregularis]|uniref:Uncharacterized protein n=1 Tax=Symbiochloris irregularis TaxID=706552 RepID=A0AAW1PYV1_9CHLO
MLVHHAIFVKALKCRKLFQGTSRTHQAGLVSQLQSAYSEICKQALRPDWRFHGVFTDGGCDLSEDMPVFWVDNMFIANDWGAFCSAIAPNVTVCAVLRDTDPVDPKQAEHREFVAARCCLPFCQKRRLLRKSTHDLDMILLHYATLMHQGVLLPNIMSYPLRGEEALSELQKIMHTAQAVGSVQPLHRSMWVRDNVCLDHKVVEEVGAETRRPDCLMACIDRFTVNRQGQFSCPISSGAILLSASVQLAPISRKQPAAQFQALAKHPISTMFDGITTKEQAAAASEAGQLPPIIDGRLTISGWWLEFDPEWMPEGASAAAHRVPGSLHPPLRPVAWFRFHNNSEVRRRWFRALPQNSKPIGPWHYKSAMASAFSLALQHVQSGDVEGNEASDEDMSDADSDFTDDEDVPPPPKLTAVQLSAKLSRKRAGNLALVKLIAPEDHMEEHRDRHPAPNVDISYVSFSGRLFRLPEHLKVA